MPTSFRELELEESYFAGVEGLNLIEDFYEPVLAAAVSYDRVAGYFSSAALSVAAKGIAGFVANGGTMRLVTSHAFTRGDVSRLQEAAEQKRLEEEILQGFEQSIKDLQGLGGAIAKDHFSAMCWMLAKGQLKVTVVVPRGADLSKLTPTEIEKFHPKFGILADSEGNEVAFSGSVNETRFAWTMNDENLDVYQGWLPGRKAYIEPKRRRFDDYWSGVDEENWYSLSLPEAVRQKIVEDYAPDDFPPALKRPKAQVTRTFGLNRPYQSQAVRSWLENGHSGILEMATGTGKTRTAAACIAESEQQGSLLTIVVVPYRHIGEQWIKELASRNPLFVSGNWRQRLGSLTGDAALGRHQHVTLVAVKNTAATDDFVTALDRLAEHFDHCLLIGDEVHWLGAPSLQAALLKCANYRLGLSATPQRYFDEAGSHLLEAYFKGVCFKFPIEKALDARDASGGRILTPYRYHPIFVELTEEESEKYWSLTRQIQAVKAERNPTPKDLQRLEELYLYRAEIGKLAENKIPSFVNLLDEFPSSLKKTLVYCADFQQMEAAQEALAKHPVFTQKVTGEESTVPRKYFNDKSQRQHILDSFESGDLDVLLAIDCLDEGVDIPSAQKGIILASSGNVKEFIQRRGRLMRVSPGKEVAEIFDFCVLPGKSDASEGIGNLIKVELRRIAEFADVALNKAEVQALVGARIGKLEKE